MSKYYCQQCGAEAKMRTVDTPAITGGSSPEREPYVCGNTSCVNANPQWVGLGDFDKR